MKQTFKLFVGLAAIVAGLTACNNQALDPVISTPGQITFRVGGPAFEASVGTKASAVENLSILESSGFNVRAVTADDSGNWDQDEVFTKGTSEKWGSTKYWPTSDPGYRFYAVHPTSINMNVVGNDGGVTIDVDNSIDVVVAKNEAATYKGVNDLAFEHIFARLGRVTISALKDYTVDALTIQLVPRTGGTYNIQSGWITNDPTNHPITSGSAESVYALAGATSPFTESGGAQISYKDNDLYLVPGEYDLSASWTVTKDSDTRTYSNKVVRVTLEAGKINNIEAALGAQILFNVSLTPWVTPATPINGGTFPVGS